MFFLPVCLSMRMSTLCTYWLPGYDFVWCILHFLKFHSKLEPPQSTLDIFKDKVILKLRSMIEKETIFWKLFLEYQHIIFMCHIMSALDETFGIANLHTWKTSVLKFINWSEILYQTSFSKKFMSIFHFSQLHYTFRDYVERLLSIPFTYDVHFLTIVVAPLSNNYGTMLWTPN